MRPPPRLPLDRLGRAGVFLLLAATAFMLPWMPSTGLDASWQVALGKFFADGRQFGPEVVFTFGPLGWSTGNMYGGHLWGSLLAWHFIQAVAAAWFLTWLAFRLSWPQRMLFLAFLIFACFKFEDCLQQTVIMLAGLELIRRADEPWRRTSLLLVALLAVPSVVKFTHLMLATTLVLLATATAVLRSQRRAGGICLGSFAALQLGSWMLCGQNPLNLPAYLRNSWEVSSGYQDAMMVASTSVQIYHGLALVALLVAYLAVRAGASDNRPRGIALGIGMAAFLFLNWKHGFVRADGHQLAWYFAAFGAVASAPFLGEAPRWRWLQLALLGGTTICAVRGAELIVPGIVRHAGVPVQQKLAALAGFIRHPGQTRAGYESALADARRQVDLPLTRSLAGNRTLDVLGDEQSVAVLNGFNYVARPVFQGYTAYTPRLAGLNRAFFESDRAPEMVLVKLQPIDSRLASMDDGAILAELPRRYDYLMMEKGFSVWRRKSNAASGAFPTPAPVRTVTTQFGGTVEVADLRLQTVWAQIDYRLNLLGRLRRFLFKAPMVWLLIADEAGRVTRHRLPAPMARHGFVLTPVFHDVAGYLRAASGNPDARAVSLTVEIAPQDRDCFHDNLTVSLATLPSPTDAGWGRQPLGSAEAPLHFVRGVAPFGAELSAANGVLEYYAHAPSTLTYRCPAAVTKLRGHFGIYEGAYAANNQHGSDGVEFLVRWRAPDGTEQVVFRRLLQPRENAADRGVQAFAVALPAGSGGELEFVTGAGPAGNSASDWSYWRDLRAENSP